MIYFDSAYLAKFYLCEPGQTQVQSLAEQAGAVGSCAWARAEVQATFHRKLREGSLTPAMFKGYGRQFEHDIAGGLWQFYPVSEALLEALSRSYLGLPANVYVRAGDALHLVCARENGFRELYTNDRHVLAAAVHFGLKAINILP